MDKPILFLYPLAKAGKELQEELKKQGGWEIYELDDIAEFNQLAGIVGRSMVFTSSPKKIAQTIEEHKIPIKRGVLKIVIINSKKGFEAEYELLKKYGVNDILSENSSLKSLQFKVNLFYQANQDAKKDNHISTKVVLKKDDKNVFINTQEIHNLQKSHLEKIGLPTDSPRDKKKFLTLSPLTEDNDPKSLEKLDLLRDSNNLKFKKSKTERLPHPEKTRKERLALVSGDDQKEKKQKLESLQMSEDENINKKDFESLEKNENLKKKKLEKLNLEDDNFTFKTGTAREKLKPNKKKKLEKLIINSSDDDDEFEKIQLNDDEKEEKEEKLQKEVKIKSEEQGGSWKDFLSSTDLSLKQKIQTIDTNFPTFFYPKQGMSLSYPLITQFLLQKNVDQKKYLQFICFIAYKKYQCLVEYFTYKENNTIKLASLPEPLKGQQEIKLNLDEAHQQQMIWWENEKFNTEKNCFVFPFFHMQKKLGFAIAEFSHCPIFDHLQAREFETLINFARSIYLRNDSI
jgi:hypothetical protein